MHLFQSGGSTSFAVAVVSSLVAIVEPALPAVWVWDSWPIYNGSNVDCSQWSWPLLQGDSFLTTPYDTADTRAEPTLFNYVQKYGVKLIHTPSGKATDALRPNLADPAARAPYVAKEVAVLLKPPSSPRLEFEGTNLDFEGVRDHCPNTTREQNPCVAGFTALVSEFREQLAAANSSKYITAAMPYTPVNYEFEYDKIKDLIDIFVLMCYDMNSYDAVGAVAGSNTQLTEVLAGIEAYGRIGVPPSKIYATVSWYGYDYVCNSTAYDPEGRHRDGCLLHIGGPCGNTCVGGNATEGGWCFRNCTSQIGYGEAADLHQWLGDRNITVSNWGVSTDGDGVTPFYEYVSPSDGRRHQVWADTPSSVAVKVAAITRTGVRGSGMWTANAFHRRDRALSAQAATALFETMATEA